MFNDNYRIRISQRTLQETFGVVRRGGKGYLYARYMRELSFKALGMLRCVSAAAPLLRANDHRHAHLATRHLAHLSCLVPNLIRSNPCEIHEHDLRHWLLATHGQPHCCPREPSL